ncbi:MAG: hypothetical protein V7709_20740, partial [Halioglobus sp.]
ISFPTPSGSIPIQSESSLHSLSRLLQRLPRLSNNSTPNITSIRQLLTTDTPSDYEADGLW